MTLSALRDDALSSTPGGFVLRLSLPWIRSLPLASLEDVCVEIDGVEQAVVVDLEGQRVAVGELVDLPTWWFVQDRVRLRADTALSSGEHEIAVTFRLVIPYLPAGPDGPLRLPFHDRRSLRADAAITARAARDVA